MEEGIGSDGRELGDAPIQANQWEGATMTKQASGSEQSIDRRTLLLLAALTGGSAALAPFGSLPAFATEAEISVANPRYNEIYKATSNYYFDNPQLSTATMPRLTCPAA